FAARPGREPAMPAPPTPTLSPLTRAPLDGGCRAARSSGSMATVSDADEHPGLPQTAATQLTAAARVVAQRAPVTLTVVRHRAQPTAATIVRLTATPVF